MLTLVSLALQKGDGVKTISLLQHNSLKHCKKHEDNKMYDNDYLIQVEQAIQKLQQGERVVSIAYGDHVVRYAEVQINDLLNLRQRIKSELRVVGMLPKRRIVFSTNKGII